VVATIVQGVHGELKRYVPNDTVHSHSSGRTAFWVVVVSLFFAYEEKRKKERKTISVVRFHVPTLFST